MDVASLQQWPGIAGQIAIVTGASRGIGRAIATALVHQGAIVIGTATTDQGAGLIGEELGNIGNRGSMSRTGRRSRRS